MNEKQQAFQLMNIDDGKDENGVPFKTREPLSTLKGSKIARSRKYGVGKDIGGDLYFHKKYADRIVPDFDKLGLDTNGMDYDYNVVKWNPKTRRVSLIESPDFNEAREPVIGRYRTFTPNDDGTYSHRDGNSNTIYHHKWLFVDDDYDGFDVDKSYDWSKRWLHDLPEKADGTNSERWQSQLGRYGIKE